MSLKVLVAFASLAAASVLARPQSTAEIINYKFEKAPSGEYSYEYDTSDGQHKQEHGQLIKISDKEQYLYVSGSYSYTGTDGKIYQVFYTAGPDGFRVSPTEGGSVAFGAPVEKGIAGDVIGSLIGGGVG